MTLNETIAADIQKLDPSSLIELYELDSTDLGGGIFRFHNGTNKLNQNLFWQGEEYIRFPIDVSGFEISGQGQFPRPSVKISNVMSAITTVLMQYGNLIGAKFTRKRTLLKYLDAVNFPGSVNPTEDPAVYFPDDVFFVDRKSLEDRDQVHFELASAADLQGVKVPGRVVIQSSCPWIYRGADCGYTGVPLYDENDEVLPTPSSAEAIAMRDAFQDLKDAQDALAVEQTDLSAAADAVTAAEQYSIETRFNYDDSMNPKYYVETTYYSTTAIWNDAPVSLGTDYIQGDFVRTEYPNKTTINIYKIQGYTRDEGALATAQAAYTAALSDRDDAQDVLDAAIVAFDAALAAVPSDDPVYTQDRCGKRVTSCKIRFGAITPNSPINFGGFPGVGR